MIDQLIFCSLGKQQFVGNEASEFTATTWVLLRPQEYKTTFYKVNCKSYCHQGNLWSYDKDVVADERTATKTKTAKYSKRCFGSILKKHLKGQSPTTKLKM